MRRIVDEDMLLAALDAQPSVPQEMEALLALHCYTQNSNKFGYTLQTFRRKPQPPLGKGSKSRHAEGECLEDAERSISVSPIGSHC